MGALAKLLSQPTAEEVEATTSFDEAGNYIQTRKLESQPESVDEVLEVFGHDPAKVRVEGPVGIRHRELADGQIVSTYSYKLRERVTSPDINDLIAQAKKAKKHREQPATGAHWFVYQAGDLQIGKVSRDGATEEIASFFIESVARAAEEFKSLSRHGIEGVQLCFPGDCIEGQVSQGGRNAWLTQETVPEQTRIFRRLLMHTVEAFAPLTDKIYLDVVNGNHDQNQRQWNTYPGDGWATECAIAVDDALKMNPDAYGHVEVRVPDKWSGHMTVPVGDSVVTVAHGHQWARNQGMRWWSEQALNQQNPAASHVLQHGHIHTYQLDTTRDRTRISSPAFDCGSDWYRETHGGDSKRGGLAYLLKSGDISRLSVV
ncbi:hypothetical protein [Mycolicibacterium septicum]|uniref:hypothetical protein n=1 Tax=Mycolicibacterium septicum TaxID=98668 RepID=UPI001AF2BB8D|nr:hypothetical protein [Mycolicibacterium septicum]QRY51774.1 hypothetical protein JVX95_31110 [Mycolicibacterium septicum]